MAYSMKDVETLTAMVMDEQGENAVNHVSNYIDQLRVDKDMLGASLWTMVLALLYHRAQPASANSCAKDQSANNSDQTPDPAPHTLPGAAVTLH